MFITNSNHGLGDILSIFSFFEREREGFFAGSNNKYFSFFKQFNPFVKQLPAGEYKGIQIEKCHEKFPNEGLHLFNKARKFAGLDILTLPKPFLFVPKQEDFFPRDGKKNIVLCFDVGREAYAQRCYHPRARMLYPEHYNSIQRFIIDTKDKFNYYEMGLNQRGFDGVQSVSKDLGVGIHVMNNADLFIGMHSGIMHLAVALDIPSIILLNFPHAHQIRFPYTDAGPDSDWIYPQNIHLHEDEGDEIVAQMSYESLKDSVEQKI